MQTIVAVDTETTGLNKYYDRIVEIGAVAFTETGDVIEEYQSIINPTIPIPYEASSIHGLSDCDVADQPEFRVIYHSFLDFMLRHSNGLIIAHNAPFDVGFINEEICRMGTPAPTSRPKFLPVVCSLKAARQTLRGIRSYSLSALMRYYNMRVEEAHRSLADCHNLKNVWLKMSPVCAHSKYNIIRWE